jgi:hypothetical protein
VSLKDISSDLWALLDNDLPLLEDDFKYYRVDKLLDDNDLAEGENAIKRIKRALESGRPNLNELSEAYVSLFSLYFRKPQPPEMRIRYEEVRRRLSNVLAKLGADLKQLDEKAKQRLSEKVKAAQQAQAAQAGQTTQQPKPQGTSPPPQQQPK